MHAYILGVARGFRKRKIEEGKITARAEAEKHTLARASVKHTYTHTQKRARTARRREK